VNRAARLRALAEGGQVLLSGVAAGLVADQPPEGTRLLYRGRRTLRGIKRPEEVWELVDVDDPRPAPITMTEVGGIPGRRQLELTAERVRPLGSLDVPEQSVRDVEQLRHVESVQLVDLARAVRPSLDIGHNERPPVVQVGRAGDGTGANDDLTRGRQAGTTLELADAYWALTEADGSSPPEVNDLELLATAAHLVGRVGDCIAARTLSTVCLVASWNTRVNWRSFCAITQTVPSAVGPVRWWPPGGSAFRPQRYKDDGGAGHAGHHRWLRRCVVWTSWKGTLNRRPPKAPIPRAPTTDHEPRANTPLDGQPRRTRQMTPQERSFCSPETSRGFLHSTGRWVTEWRA
jgi:hypothetical protein